jgi:hypothetical protein
MNSKFQRIKELFNSEISGWKQNRDIKKSTKPIPYLEFPADVFTDIVWKPIKAFFPLLILAVILGAMSGSFWFTAVFGIIPMVAGIGLIAVRMFHARRDIVRYEGEIADWEFIGNVERVVDKIELADVIGSAIWKKARRQKNAKTKGGVTYYWVDVPGNKYPVRIPVQKTTKPLPIGTQICIYAGANIINNYEKETAVFERIYTFKKTTADA